MQLFWSHYYSSLWLLPMRRNLLKSQLKPLSSEEAVEVVARALDLAQAQWWWCANQDALNNVAVNLPQSSLCQFQSWNQSQSQFLLPAAHHQINHAAIADQTEADQAAVIALTKAVVANNFSKFQLINMIKSHILTSNKQNDFREKFNDFLFF